MRIIERVFPIKNIMPKPILRVAAYCRVSSQYDEQMRSFDLQKEYYEDKIKNHMGWELAGIYEDKYSGRTIGKRKQFMQMISDCREGHIDIILTKSMSRFGRNTLETIIVMSELKELGVDVHFEIENLQLLQKKSDLMLTIYAAIYQEESEQKSFNIKWGIKRSFESVDSKYHNRICFGYRHGDNGRLELEPKEATIVKDIFRLYLNGYSLRQLSCELEQRGLKSPRGYNKWGPETLSKLLSNEKYTGNVLLQKTIVEDFFSGKQIKNDGKLAQYLVSNSNPVIISQELFDMVQLEKQRRKER